MTDKEKEGACSVEGGGVTAKYEGNIVKGLGKIIRKGEKEKGTNDDIGRGKVNWTGKNTRSGEPPDWLDPLGTGKIMGRKKVHRTIHGWDVGKEVRVRFRFGTGGRGTKWYVCVMGDGRGNGKNVMTGKMNRAGVGIEKMKKDYHDIGHGTGKY